MDYFDYNQFSDFNVKEFLEESQERDKQRLEEELERIERQLDERSRIHEEVIEELESKLDWYTERLELLYKRRQGRHGEREEFKQKIDRFYRELRQEKRNHWIDCQELKEEHRKLLRELNKVKESIWPI